MNRVRTLLRSGAWLTRERIRVVTVALLVAFGAGYVFLTVTANGLIDQLGRPLGTDFSNVYAAGTYVLDGDPEAPFNPARQYAREQKIFGEATLFYGWQYPPFFLFIAAALALMPYGIALVVWQGTTLGLYLLTIQGILIPSFRGPRGANPKSITTKVEGPALKFRFRTPWLWIPALARLAHSAGMTVGPSPSGGNDHLWLLLACAFPAVLVNIGHGQNGFLTAALLGAALVQLDRRPLLAGILLGLLAYKPQFGLMIPIVLAASGRWRTFAAVATAIAVLAIVTTITFGPHVWQAFLDSVRFSRLVLEQGNAGWYRMQSIFAWARMWGGAIALAYVLQAAVVVTLGGALFWLWRGIAPYPLKAAALCIATILAAPYSFDYDMMVLAPAIAFFAADGLARGFGPWEKTALAVLWLTPAIARGIAEMTLIPLGVLAMLGIFILLLPRSAFQLSSPMVAVQRQPRPDLNV